MKKQVHVIISGRVQGVWYRVSTKKMATTLGLLGWVKNRSDGAVEALFEGDEDVIHRMIAWCKQGPPLAQVTEVKVKDKQPTGEFKEFSISS